MMFRRLWDGAEKCSLRDLRLDEARPALLLGLELHPDNMSVLPWAVFMAAVVARGVVVGESVLN